MDDINPLIQLTHYQQPDKVPFWEVWFNMTDFFHRRYGCYDHIDNRIAMAKELGMHAVGLGTINTETTFGRYAETADGQCHYQGGHLESLEQLHNRPYPNWDQVINHWKTDRKKIADAGLACWVTLVHCFHAALISLGLEGLTFIPNTVDSARF